MAAFARRDLATVVAAFAPDAELEFAGRSPRAKTYRGVDSIRDLLARTGPLSGGTFKAEVTDVVANDRHAIALEHATGRVGDKTLDVTSLLHFQLRDGKIVRLRSHYSDQYAVDEFWTYAVKEAMRTSVASDRSGEV